MKQVKECNIKKISNKIFEEAYKDRDNPKLPRELWDEMIDGIRCMEQAINEVKNKKIIELSGLNSKEITLKLFMEEKYPTNWHERVFLVRFFRFLPNFYSLLKYNKLKEEWDSSENKEDKIFNSEINPEIFEK